MALDAALLEAREAYLRTAVNERVIDASAAAEIQAAVAQANDDPLRVAIDGLMRDELLRQLAKERGVSLDAEPMSEVGAYASQDVTAQIRVVSVVEPEVPAASPGGDWPGPAEPGVDFSPALAARARALARAGEALASGVAPADIEASLVAAGWVAQARDVWLARSGSPADVPASILAAARDPATVAGARIGPFADLVTGRSAIATILARRPTSSTADSAGFARDSVDAGVLGRWTEARAAERALAQAMMDGWREQPRPVVRVREVVIGSADLEGIAGPYASFGHLVVGQLPPTARVAGATDETTAAHLAAQLRALPRPDRERRFKELVAQANATGSSDPLKVSGETGFFAKAQLLPELADAAFGPAVDGDIIGPVTTVAGPELFILRARFEGTLDERANAALVEAQAATDLVALARRISPPGQARRAVGDLWRAEDEMIGSAVHWAAYVDTPIDSLSDPIVLDGQIVVVQPLERRVAVVDRPTLDRLLVAGFDAWLADRVARASIVRDPEPLPGVLIEPSPSASPSGIDASPPGPVSVPPLQPSGNPPIPFPTVPTAP